MKKKLTLREIAPYLPYGLKVLLTESNKTAEMFVLNKILFRHQIQIQTIYGTYGDMYFKPILRPLSDLTKEIEVNGKKFVPIEEIKESQRHLFFREDIENPLEGMQYSEMQKLFSWHFDVFGLIESGLAIDFKKIK